MSAVLQSADADALVATLPEPAPNRRYILFQFSETDKAAFREVQVRMRDIAWSARVGKSLLSVKMAPGFCSLSPFDPSQTSYSVLAALPGARVMKPLFVEETIADLLAKTGHENLASCAELGLAASGLTN